MVACGMSKPALLPPGQRALDHFPRFGLSQYANRVPDVPDRWTVDIGGDVGPITIDALFKGYDAGLKALQDVLIRLVVANSPANGIQLSVLQTIYDIFPRTGALTGLGAAHRKRQRQRPGFFQHHSY